MIDIIRLTDIYKLNISIQDFNTKFGYSWDELFSGLDINTDGGVYEIVFDLTRATSNNVYMFINGNQTASNYASGALNTTSMTSGQALIMPTNFSGQAAGVTTLTKLGSTAFAGTEACANNSYVESSVWYANSTATGSNITSITFLSAAGNFNNATVKIYKR